jgi:outer membrane protein assembly factor BamB
MAHVFWQAPITALGPPALDDSSVYFSTRDHYLAAVNRRTGDVRWVAYSGVSGDPRARDTPVRAADVVVFGDEYLFGIELVHGTRRWVFGKTGGVEPRVGIFRFGSDGTRVYAGSAVGAVFAVDAATGQQLWRSDLLPGTDHLTRVDAVGGGRVYAIVSFDGPFYVERVYALDTTTGDVIWTYDRGRSSLARDALLTSSGPAGSLLLLALDNGRIVALDAATGSEHWTIGPVAVGTALDDRRMTVSGGVLVATSTGGTATDFIAGYDFTTGQESWRVLSDQGSAQGNLGRVTSDNTLAYITFTNGVIGAYDLRSGVRRWLRRAPVGFFVSAPIISHDTFFVAGYDAAYAIAR